MGTSKAIFRARLPSRPTTTDVCYASMASIRQNWRDAMKSILLPVDQNEQMPSAFETARLAANLFDGQVECAALSPAFSEIVAPYPIVAVSVPPHDWDDDEYSRRLRRTFEEYAKQQLTDSREAARFRWRGGSLIQDAVLGSLARAFDLTVLNRPGARGARMAVLENALFESGRPVLMAPPSPPKIVWPDCGHSLERQHRGMPRDRNGHADPVQSQARHCVERRRQYGPRSQRPGGGKLPGGSLYSRHREIGRASCRER